VSPAPHVDVDRLRADFEALASIGSTPDGGIDRTTSSDAHLAARSWFLGRATEAGLETRIDPAGNHSALLASGSQQSRTLLLGSHLDSVPNGGRYDGALGVLAALETLRVVRESGIALPVTLEAIDFTDEEGTLVGLLGSWALVGALTNEVLANPRGGIDALKRGLARAGLDPARLSEARRDPSSLAAYLELHIEQGPVLERSRVDIGVVSGIVGSRSFRFRFRGTRSHAGTTSMDARRDAVVGASRFAVGVREVVVRDFPGCVATVGDIRVEPGAYNVVPCQAVIKLEFRSQEEQQLDRLEETLLSLGHLEAEREHLELDVAPVGRWISAPMDPGLRATIATVTAALGLSSLELPSGAGHDAQALATVTRSAMIFVPSAGGLSHDPGEQTVWRDGVNGANVLLGTALEVARTG
jgi:N-carbamoyl-L-amino-acid hydrolase